MKRIISEIAQVILFVAIFLGVAVLWEGGTIDIVKEIIAALLGYVVTRVINHFVFKESKNKEN